MGHLLLGAHVEARGGVCPPALLLAALFLLSLNLELGLQPAMVLLSFTLTVLRSQAYAANPGFFSVPWELDSRASCSKPSYP